MILGLLLTNTLLIKKHLYLQKLITLSSEKLDRSKYPQKLMFWNNKAEIFENQLQTTDGQGLAFLEKVHQHWQRKICSPTSICLKNEGLPRVFLANKEQSHHKSQILGLIVRKIRTLRLCQLCHLKESHLLSPLYSAFLILSLRYNLAY